MEDIGYFISKNLLFCLFFILLLAVYGLFELVQSKKSRYAISVVDAVLKVNKGRGVYLDVRNSGNYDNTHIIGAENIALEQISQEHKKLAKYKSKPVVIYGDNAQKAMQEFRKLGFEQVFILKGGLSAWLQADYPVKSLPN